MLEKSVENHWYNTFVNLVFVDDQSGDVIAVFTEEENVPVPGEGQELAINYHNHKDDQEAENVGQFIVSSLEYSYTLRDYDIPDEIREENNLEGDEIAQQTVINVVVYVDSIEDENQSEDPD